MSWELWLRLASTAISFGGLAFNGERLRKIAFIFLALLGCTFVVREISYQRRIDHLQEQIVSNLAASVFVMSADQLWENVTGRDITRQDFDDALNQADEAHRVIHQDMAHQYSRSS
jgi:hypothetical protein